MSSYPGLPYRREPSTPSSPQSRHPPPPPPLTAAPAAGVEDSPTVPGRLARYNNIHAVPSAPPSPSLPSVPGTVSSSSRSHWKAAPSPLHTSTVFSAPSSASPRSSQFPFAGRDPRIFPRTPTTPQSPQTNHALGDSFVGIAQTGDVVVTGDRSFFKETPSPPTSPFSDRSGSISSFLPPNDSSTAASSPVTSKPPAGFAADNLPNMAGGHPKSEAIRGAPRTSSIDSALSAISVRTQSQQQGSPDSSAGTTDVATLIAAAGSPEAVIQYLLKEKQSQSQQNAQLWRLVDKQRAMILGLNKDLERALKDKEKYRKKLKEVMGAHDSLSTRGDGTESHTNMIPRIDVNANKELVESPKSPQMADQPDSAKESPVDMSLAPYPITPPADQVTNNGPPSAVGELLDPRSAMPKSSEHALDNYDHEAEDPSQQQEKKGSGSSRELPYLVSLPPSRSLPSEPPRMPPPKPPGAPPSLSIIEATPMMDQGSPTFPPPSAPPPRKPPPAPLQLKKEVPAPVMPPPDDDNDSESDYDSLLEVDELPIPVKRGRRRTREEDDAMREALAEQEAEARSLSKKSKLSGQKVTPTSTAPEIALPNPPASPRVFPPQPGMVRENVPASLAGVLNGDDVKKTTLMAPPLMSPGLPASPRPMALKSPVASPPLSPRTVPAGPLSPRAPRQPIPLPPNTPISTASSTDAQRPGSAKQSSSGKKGIEPAQPSPATSRESPVERTRVFKGFVTEDYPDLILPPNALPSIEVKVASSRMKPPRASLISLTQLEEDPVFTLAVYSRVEGGELWRVEKDTTSLSKLDIRMKQCAAFTARTPDRSLFTGHAPAKLDARRTILNQYLDELLNTPLDSATALELCKYLSSNPLPPNLDEMIGPAGGPNNEEAASQKGPGGRPFKSGYLTKRGKNFGGWKARFFVLDGPHLRYYETPGGAHLGTIKLQKAQIGKQSQHNNDAANGDELDNQYRHAFLVLEPKKKDSTSHVKHVLCAESDKERDQWVDALLHWIDYREPGSEESQPSETHQRHASGGSGSQPTKKKGQPAKTQPRRSNSQDGLIGMSYDSVKPGSAPDGAPPRHRGTATPDLMERTPPSATYNISGPKDPHIISDTTAWSGKPALAIPGPSMDEKKQRKRSFFGFGPKTRSSTDDQDSLFGSSAPSVAQSEPRGPMRQVFGAPLAEAVRYNGPMDVSVPLPSVVYRCIQYLDAKNAIMEEGIFRLSGSNVVIKQLRERFNTEGDVNLVTDETYYDIHAVASLLKLYLRELPTTILTRELHMQFISVTEMSVHPEKIAALSELVVRLPQANATLLKYLIAFLIKIINNADYNKMTVRNVGIVFSPTLNIPAPIFALLLQNYEAVFGIEPEEYELPSPVSSEAGSRNPFDHPRRPSTAGATESPHRQRLLEQTQQRMTPTPPPILNGGLRPTATPPPPRRSSYEPNYQGFPTNGDPRAGYDTGYHAAPAYDRPVYGTPYESETGEDMDQSFVGRAKKRESSMFLGANPMGLTTQASKSRLREETRMQ